jgi:hypothetical protein
MTDRSVQPPEVLFDNSVSCIVGRWSVANPGGSRSRNALRWGEVGVIGAGHDAIAAISSDNAKGIEFKPIRLFLLLKILIYAIR